MDLATYLHRINYTANPLPVLQHLKDLHLAHLQSIPFENLDIHLGRPIALDLERIYQKIVVEKRGGFCYELNGLFFQLLKTIGFDVRLISARVHNDQRAYNPEFDHMAIIARVSEQQYLVDVGFGKFALEPLRIHLDEEQQIKNGLFRIVTFNSKYMDVQQKKLDGEWRSIYIFSPRGRQLEDFESMCQYHQSSPDSHFTQKRVCTISTSGGRTTLSDRELITTIDGMRHVREVGDEAEFNTILREVFGMELSTL